MANVELVSLDLRCDWPALGPWKADGGSEDCTNRSVYALMDASLVVGNYCRNHAKKAAGDYVRAKGFAKKATA